jgi:L-asparaginase II
MQAANGRMVCKRGAEGYQAIGIMPKVLSDSSPGVGIAFKVSDGDLLFRTIDIEPKNRVRPAVSLEILRQLGALNPEELGALSDFGPTLPVKNNRGTTVGISRPVFRLGKAG